MEATPFRKVRSTGVRCVRTLQAGCSTGAARSLVTTWLVGWCCLMLACTPHGLPAAAHRAQQEIFQRGSSAGDLSGAAPWPAPLLRFVLERSRMLLNCRRQPGAAGAARAGLPGIPCMLPVQNAPHVVWGVFGSSPQVQTDRGTGSESERVKLKLMVRVEAVEYDAEGALSQGVEYEASTCGSRAIQPER